ncbi:MAG: hydantoinase B/oxoprolinase family protein [Coxiellaceae bacterium]|nr:hydantoinase B/oxoprolinase family protein [Coxiellaceae bacterium]
MTKLQVQKKWKFWIDRGGTFTDVIGVSPEGVIKTCKLLSSDSQHYDDASIEGIRRLFHLREDQAIPTDQIDSVRIGTTLATNALLERKGADTALVTSYGFRDALSIGFQQRPDLFSLEITKPDALYKCVIETTQRQDVHGQVIQPLDKDRLYDQLMLAKQRGITSVAIVFMHAYRYPEDERRSKKIASDIGFDEVICSHEIAKVMGFIMRGNTTVVDAYLTPVFGSYLNQLQQQLPDVKILMMQSNGGLLPTALYRAKDSLLSGPAGGVIAGAHIAKRLACPKLITFDMGGTSTDVAYYAGSLNRNYESIVAGIPVQLPMLDIETIASGGGSIIAFRQGRFCVGPESAGATPGPACYGKGGPLTITDCHVMLGHIRADFFPQCFGKCGEQAIDVSVVNELFEQLTKKINQATSQSYTLTDVAHGFIRVAVTQMAGAIKKITLQKGYDLTNAVLCSFGGAAAQHACAVSDELGVSQVVISPYASLFSALGIGLSDIRSIKQQSVEQLIHSAFSKLEPLYDQLIKSFEVVDIDSSKVKFYRHMHLKYQGTDAVIVIPWQQDYEDIFNQQYLSMYGFTMPEREIICQEISVEQVVQSNELIQMLSAEGFRHVADISGVMNRYQLAKDKSVCGPLTIVEKHTATVLPLGWSATIDNEKNLWLRRDKKLQQTDIDTQDADPVWLEVFNYLFMSIAEEMGEALANTAYSVNIKERRDFSCAIFDVSGGLVANAPHMPVHLGSMGASVKAISEHFKNTMHAGDVYMLNDPYAGGTHLPDVTVVTPVFLGQAQPRFYVASRGHHADIGGSQPGSMPAHSDNIEQEGILFTYAHIVKQGTFDEQYIRSCLSQKPYPARNIKQNIADLKAQIAANQRGVNQIIKMVEQHSLKVVNAYMKFVQANAESAVREVIACLSDGEFIQRMDCGAEIHVAIRVDKQKRDCEIDFTGTCGAEQTNFNAPKAVTTAAVLYVFRCLVQRNIPLNQGCLLPIKIIIPKGSLLDPVSPRAVVAGNVETSQNIVEALFSAMGVMAQSQSTMNNFTFGNARYQYYETIAGGSGAGDGFNGADAVQVHMTNTRLTDHEILEFRFPVRVNRFEVRQHSAGKGKYTGGEGVIREIYFSESMIVNLLSEHRQFPPMGMQQGGDGVCGENVIIRVNNKKEKLGASAVCQVETGDILQIKTPGGGGYGVN